MNNTSFKIFLTALIISILVFLGLLFLTYMLPKKEKIEVEYVTNANIFFTVESCVNKYVSLVQSKDSEAVYNLIDDDYKAKNDITIYNALTINYDIPDGYSFIADKMLQDKNKKYTYYVKGYLKDNFFVEDINSKADKKSYGIIIKLDVVNKTYSVIPSGKEEYFDAI